MRRIGALVAEINGATPTPFRFGYAARCVSLGRKAGFLQFVDAQDRPKSNVLTGRLGVLAKEAILQYVMRSIQLTRIWANAYRWPHSLAAKEVTQRENLQFTTNV